MNPSLFLQLIQTWFGVALAKVSVTVNGKAAEEPTLYESMLMPEYSVDLKWGSVSASYSNVAADVVSLDSELPLKKRDSIGFANGDIPKLGMKFAKGEKEIQDIKIMLAKGLPNPTVAARIFNDLPKLAKGVRERNEFMFLQGISTGVALAQDADNTGTAIRVSYGYKDANKFTSEIDWLASGYTPISDIRRVVDEADVKPSVLMLSKKAFDAIKSSTEGKELVATTNGMIILSNSILAAPSNDALKSAISTELGLEVIVVDRRIQIEKNGNRSYLKPFEENTLVFLPSKTIGRLVYGTPVEESMPVDGVQYGKVSDGTGASYMLISKFSNNEPLREFTSVQALVLPVIDSVDSIYTLNILGAKEDAQTEGNSTFLYATVTYTKASVIAAVNANGGNVASDVTDAKLLAAINKLNDANKAAAVAAFVTP